MDKLKIRVDGKFKQVPVSALDNDSNFISDSDYVHTDNNFTDEDKEKLDNLENVSVDGKNIPFEDNYGYGTPDNVQDALDFAFEEIDNRMTYSDVKATYVSYHSEQKLNATQQARARTNIGIPSSCILHNQAQSLSDSSKQMARHNIGVRGFTNLGEVDLADYGDNVYNFIDTLTGEGTYRFIDNIDYFNWIVEVWWLGDYSVGQKYICEDEGYIYQYYRSGYYDEDNDTYEWSDWTSYLTLDVANNVFALKNHNHYTSVNTSYDIRKYLDTLSAFNFKELRVKSSSSQRMYMVRIEYVNYSLNGVTKYVRYQEYYDLEEPNKIYKRTGTSTSSVFSSTTWGDWYVFEGIKEN